MWIGKSIWKKYPGKSTHLLPGYFFDGGALKSYNKRIVNSPRKASNATKTVKKHIRAVRKGHLDMAAEKEGEESYKSDAC